MTRPGESVEGITVPEGDPDALRTAGRQLQGVAAQLEGSSSQLSGLPSLMSGWAGPASSVFAQMTGEEAAAVRAASASVSIAALNVDMNADELEDAQRRARRAIRRAEAAREEINQAREDIREAERAQDDAKGRMAVARLAREVAEQQLVASLLDAVGGGAAAAAAIQLADAQYRDAERDLQGAIEREARARRRLAAAEDELRDARKAGRDAAQDAEDAGLMIQSALAMMPTGALAMPGAPAQAHLAAAAGIGCTQPPRTGDVPLSEREPPEHWPGWMKEWFKVGRGTVTAADGTLDLGKAAVENPEKVPGAAWGLAERTYHDPLGTGQALIGYDELAAGRYSDWFGQMGLAALGGAAGTLPARAHRLHRVVGPPNLQRLGVNQPTWGPAFAGRRLDFSKPDLGARPDGGSKVSIPPNREWLAREYPAGVRYTRAGYPMFTPYAVERVAVKGLTGDMTNDNKLSNAAAGIPGREPPDGFTWHHVEDGRTMELVPSKLHEATKHTGGRAAMPDQVREVTPGGVFTPGERLGAGFGAGTGVTAGGDPIRP